MLAALTVFTNRDGLLSVIAPIGLAAAVPTCLVVDLDPNGPLLPGVATLAALVESGPRRVDLQPAAEGTAMLANGGICPEEAETVVRHLLDGWPHVVLRSDVDRGLFAPVVPVHPMLPGWPYGDPSRFCVYQEAGFRVERPAQGIVLPRPTAGTVGKLLNGALPPKSRWISAWREVWAHPWR